MDGVLVIDKPAGPTSHDVVARVRRALQISRIGHTGTLDPLATGVLPLVVGRATRLAQFLTADDKEYIAEVKFGATSATYDAEGPLSPGPEPETCTREALVEALAAFRGTFSQMPPPFSAKKVGGMRAYKLARQEKPVTLQPIDVTVTDLELLGFEAGAATLRIVSSSGFYVRSLAHELGERIGCGGYLSSLRRTRAGTFTLTEAVPLDAVERAEPDALDRLVGVDRLLPHLPAVHLTESGMQRATHGNTLRPTDMTSGAAALTEVDTEARVRLVSPSGALVAVARKGPDGALHPSVVLV